MGISKKMWFIIGGGVLAVILIIVLLSTSSKSRNTSSAPTGPVTLNVWMTFEDSENLDPIFSDYKKTHPNVTIIYTKKNVDTYEQDLLNALAAGNGPDIFVINN